jgi:hypothetical protein
MKRAIFTSLAVLVAWGVGASFALAQFGTLGQPPIRPRPTVSPYINMGTGAQGYYGLIKPQTDANRSIQDLQNNLSRMGLDSSGQAATDPNNPLGGSTPGLQTGHAATYFNYSHYYPQNAPIGSGGSGMGGIGSGLGGVNPYFYNQGPFGGGFGFGAGGRTFFGPTFGVVVR